MAHPVPVHRTVLVVDVSAFTDRRRTDLHQLTVRRGLYQLLTQAFADAGVPWEECDHEDRGDGVLVIVPPTVPKAPLVEALPERLVTALREHNTNHPVEEQIRLRLALHAGEIHYDAHGVVGHAVNLAFRLLDAQPFKEAHRRATASLSMITSAWFFEEVVWHSATAERDRYHRIRVTTKETDTVGWVRLVDNRSTHLDGGPPARTAVQHQLPSGNRHFTGRGTELARLTALVDEAGATATGMVAAIDGTAGVGKTALALAWASQVGDRFPDGGLHVNLRGFDQREPADPGQVLDGLLQTLGVPPQSVPVDFDAKSALYRAMLTDRRMLVILDNARSSDQVRPLLPGSPSCAAVVTSRNRLDSLLVRDGAHRITLDVLSDADALALLAKRVDAGRLEPDPEATAELVRLCAHLPLALSVAAARAANQPRLSLSDLVGELRDERGRLDALDLGEPDLDPRAVFSWSYKALSAPAARLFRLLGVHPGADIGEPACRALAGADVHAVIRELTSAHLLSEYLPGRYRLHDLLRAYAAEMAGADPERPAAAARLVEHYLTTTIRADSHIQPHRHLDGGLVVSGDAAGEAIAGYDGAMAWFGAEHLAILGLVGFAAEIGMAGHAWRLAWACTTFLRRTGRRSERVAIHRTALAAARDADDRLGEATISRNLATANARIGDFAEVEYLLDRAARLYTELDDQRGAFKNHLAYTRVLGAQGKHTDALGHAEIAWTLVRDTGDELGHADALTAMADELALLDQHVEARPLGARALDLYTANGHTEGEADVLLTLGDIESALGRNDQAVDCYRRSYALDSLLGDRYWAAVSLERLAGTYPDADDRVRALREALAIYQEIQHPAAARVDAELSARGDPADDER